MQGVLEEISDARREIVDEKGAMAQVKGWKLLLSKITSSRNRVRQEGEDSRLLQGTASSAG